MEFYKSHQTLRQGNAALVKAGVLSETTGCSLADQPIMYTSLIPQGASCSWQKQNIYIGCEVTRNVT